MLQVECCPQTQTGQVATHSVCSCVIIKQGALAVNLSDEHAMVPLQYWRCHSYHNQYTLVTAPNIDLMVAVVVLR